MLHLFRVDIGETYIFETDLVFQDVKTLKLAIEREHGISISKQILIINGGDLLDDDHVHICMKTRETGAGTEENPIYLLDKSHLERSRPIQIPLTSNEIPTIDDSIIQRWKSMPATYDTIVQRADTAQNFYKYSQKIIQNCERFIRDQQAQYQGWMAVIANIEDTLESFLLNRTSFDRSYQTYLSERINYLDLFQSLPQSIEILHQLKLPNPLSTSMDVSQGIHQKSSLSSSSSTSSKIDLSMASNTNCTSTMDNDSSNASSTNSLFQWITAQLGNMKIDDIIHGCQHVIDECTDELLIKMNQNIDDLSKKISDPELKHIRGIEERFAHLQQQLTIAQRLEHSQKDCADYLISQRQSFSSNVGNQRDLTLIRDVSNIHAQNLIDIIERHKQLLDIEKRIRKSKQEIIDQLHRRFRNLMVLQRDLVDYDAKLSLFIHKLNRTRKTMGFLRQLNKTPHLYYLFISECYRRKQYSNIFNQFTENIYREVKHLYQEEIIRRQQFIQQYEPHFLFNLLPGLKILPTFFIKEPLPYFDGTLPDLTINELNQIFENYSQIKQTTENPITIDSSSNLSSLIRCTNMLIEKNVQSMATSPISIPTNRFINEESNKTCSESPTNSSRSTVVRSQSSLSSTDIESSNTISNENQSIDKNNTPTKEISVERSLKDENISTVDPLMKSRTSSINHHEDDDDFIQCSLETVYTSTEINSSPIQNSNSIEEKDRENRRAIISAFLLFKTNVENNRIIQHSIFQNYHRTVIEIIENLEKLKFDHQKQIEELRSEIQTYLHENENLKIQLEINEQLKQEWMSKYSSLEINFNQFRRTSDKETSQIVKALQSDFEFEMEKLRCEHQEILKSLTNENSNKQIFPMTTIQTQTDQPLTNDRHTSFSFSFQNQDQSTQTDFSFSIQNQSSQTFNDENDEFMRRSINKDQQTQFNLAIQRAVQNSTNGFKKQILQLEQQLNEKRKKILKLKECVKKLQNFYTLSTASSPPLQLPISTITTVSSPLISTMNDENNIVPSISGSVLLTSSTDDEQSLKDQENCSQTDQNNHRTDFLHRSEPISMPSTFIAQSLLTAGNAATSPKTEQPSSATVKNLLMDHCFKSSPNDHSAAIELYTPFAASPPNPLAIATSPQTPIQLSSFFNSPSSNSPLSRLPNHGTPQASPIAFFTVNRSDHVIIYYNSIYQHYMILNFLPTLHFIHSDCYELFHIQQKQNSTQINHTENIRSNMNLNPSSLIGSLTNDNGNNSSSILVNTSMLNSTLVGINGLNPSTIPLLGQVTDKEYCQAKKINNRFNVPLGTKFYRVRVIPWKPSISSTTSQV